MQRWCGKAERQRWCDKAEKRWQGGKAVARRKSGGKAKKLLGAGITLLGIKIPKKYPK